MWFLIQLRDLKKQVRLQLEETKDPEKGGLGHTDSPIEESSNNAEDLYARIPGIQLRTGEDGSRKFIVSWTSAEDPLHPAHKPLGHRLVINLMLILISFVVTAASSVDAAVLERAAKDFGISDVTEALGGTGIYLVGFGVGTLLSSPLSEFVGRYPVYLGTLVIFGIWVMASALSPDIGAQIVFRLLAGVTGSAPLTVAGGSISDIFSPKERTWVFPLFAISGFGGPILGPVMSAYIGYDPRHVLSWHWADWITLILDGLVLFFVVLFMEETLAPRLLKYKAHYFRKLTGDSRFMSEAEATGKSVMEILRISFMRPFHLSLEPIVLMFTLYLTVVYIIIFTFLDGYPFIFEMVYGINSGLTNTIFVALFVGVLLCLPLVPFIYKRTKAQLSRDGDDGHGHSIHRESRLLFAMFGAPAIPIGLFWMAWTDFRSISIWSPIVASLPIGFGIISIFLSAYMYIIDSYEMYAASALTFTAVVRYLAAGGMTVVGVPWYNNLGPNYTLTILACISVAALPIPYVLYVWGSKVRARSKYAVNHGT